MKRYLWILVLLPVALQGQDTFNKRMCFGFPAAVITSIVPTDSFYYATSIIADSVFPYRTGNAFLKFGLDGELLDIRTVTDTGKTYETWFDNFIPVGDGGFAAPGYSFDSTTSTILIRYGPQGDTLFTRSYFSPNAPGSEFIQPRGGMVSTSEGGFLLANAIGNNNSGPDIYLIKTDSLGNMEWDKIYPNGSWNRPESIISAPDGKYIIGAVKTNQYATNSNYTYQCHVFQVDSLGNMEWDYLSPVSSGPQRSSQHHNRPELRYRRYGRLGTKRKDRQPYLSQHHRKGHCAQHDPIQPSQGRCQPMPVRRRNGRIPGKGPFGH